MALNIATSVEKRATTFALTQEFRNKYNITVNEPAQTHFSVEGVQTYSPEEIKAMAARAGRVSDKAQKEGGYLSLQAYKLDNEIQFLENAPSNKEKVQTLKAKSKAKLQLAKPLKDGSKDDKPKPIKPSVRNQMARANQKTVKLTKEQQKVKAMEQKLSDLTKKYKEHFGDELKSGKKTKNKEREQPKQGQQPQNEQKHEENNENEQFEFSEGEGEQALPQAPQKPSKSMASVTKPQQKDKDDSFQDVDWEPKRSEASSSRLKASTYSERLGNAVHLLFD